MPETPDTDRTLTSALIAEAPKALLPIGKF